MGLVDSAEGLYEAGHRGSVSRLVDEFGEERRGEIVEVYARHRKYWEDSSSVRKFLPVFSHIGARNELIYIDGLDAA